MLARDDGAEQGTMIKETLFNPESGNAFPIRDLGFLLPSPNRTDVSPVTPTHRRLTQFTQLCLRSFFC